MAKTAVPVIDRRSIGLTSTTAISGTLSGEVPGSVVYVYVNMRRAGTTRIGTDGRWLLPISSLAFGSRVPRLAEGDRVYAQARAVGKDLSDPTPVYVVGGIDQPSAPRAVDDATGYDRDTVYERDVVLSGSVALPRNYALSSSPEVPFDSATVNGGTVASGAKVTLYLDGTRLTEVRTDRYGNWRVDLSLDAEASTHPHMPLSKGARLTARASRTVVMPDGSEEHVLLPSVESAPSVVDGGYFRKRLVDFWPAQWRADDAETGDLTRLTRVLAVTLDEMKSVVDRFPEVLDAERCDQKYLGPISNLLGYPLNRLDSEPSQRLQLRNAAEFWRRKGVPDLFRVIFYLLDYDVRVVELWTKDYATFHPGILDIHGVEVYPRESHPEGPPEAAPELVENGGEWYKSPYFGIDIYPVTSYHPTPRYPYLTDEIYCPLETTSTSASLSLDDLKYLIERVDHFRPAHTVLDYISFRMELLECGPLPRESVRTTVTWQPEEPGWLPAYCEPGDPTYYRDGLRSTRPDRRGTIAVGVTRDPTAYNHSEQPWIRLKRLPERGYCHPQEDLVFSLIPFGDEPYTAYLRRDGMGFGMYPVEDEVGTVDNNDWPSRDPLADPPTRDGKHRAYISRLDIRTRSYSGSASPAITPSRSMERPAPMRTWSSVTGASVRW